MNYIGAGQMLQGSYLAVPSRIANLQPREESLSKGQAHNCRRGIGLAWGWIVCSNLCTDIDDWMVYVLL